MGRGGGGMGDLSRGLLERLGEGEGGGGGVSPKKLHRGQTRYLCRPRFCLPIDFAEYAALPPTLCCKLLNIE
jgi:hypothetical protein